MRVSLRRVQFVRSLVVVSTLYGFPDDILLDLYYERKIRFPPRVPKREPDETREQWWERVEMAFADYGYLAFKAYRRHKGIEQDPKAEPKPLKR